MRSPAVRRTQPPQHTSIKKQLPGITEGPIAAQLLLFFFPILFGTFFQQLYNTVDAIVVGRFVGKTALAAVGGTTGTLINLFVGFFVGLSSGCGVIISQYYGARDQRAVERCVHTAFTFAILSGTIITIVGLLGANAALRAMSVPDELMPDASAYLRIYFLGMIPSLIYNMGAAILRAIGDSKRPLWFLIASCITNIILDLIFVLLLRLGVRGAALATILSQLVSAVMVVLILHHSEEGVEIRLKQLRIEGSWLRKMVYVGFPAGLQSTMYTISNIIIQAKVNAFGTDTIAAWTAYGKVDVLYWMIINAFGISITTFVGQNYGAGKMDRVKQGIRSCLALSFGTTVLLSTLLWFFGHYMLALFSADAAVLAIGMRVLRFLVPTFVSYVVIEIYSGALRGIGNSWIPMLMTCLGVCVLRIVWIVVAVPLHRDILTLVFAYPLTWCVTSLAFLVYLHYHPVFVRARERSSVDNQ